MAEERMSVHSPETTARICDEFRATLKAAPEVSPSPETLESIAHAMLDEGISSAYDLSFLVQEGQLPDHVVSQLTQHAESEIAKLVVTRFVQIRQHACSGWASSSVRSLIGAIEKAGGEEVRVPSTSSTTPSLLPHPCDVTGALKRVSDPKRITALASKVARVEHPGKPSRSSSSEIKQHPDTADLSLRKAMKQTMEDEIDKCMSLFMAVGDGSPPISATVL